MVTSKKEEDSAASKREENVVFNLPTFQEDAELWFCQIEAIFRIRRVNSQLMRYSHTVAALPISAAKLVRDLIQNIPDSNPYDKLKSAIITRSGGSEAERLRRFSADTELGDRTPSQMFRDLRALVPEDRFSPSVWREFFLNRLPSDMAALLASEPDGTPLSELIRRADRMHERQSARSIATVESGSADSVILASIRALQDEVSALKRQRQRESSVPDSMTGDLCFYHRRFGDKARRCVLPCRLSAEFQRSGNVNARQ